ncbi:phage replication protein [Bacillus thuringiensis serovar morrisoni str. 4AA1]|nr:MULTISPECIES: hypothetical protein [Bacillus cereus group]AGV99376.1 hypothetical protein proCM3_gp14 [Bacillus phage proCM3]MRA95336.1 hypothetical protein [Bacillus thuringiensis]OTY41253.1 hypothetical protein BK736_11525 [Bacillus thuringiensis serovar poloniensis]RUR63670.1 hypothetical protein ELS81_09765 [Bacillus sp. VKPM B-3276]UOC00866.1 phage replication protein [Bacillus thuringiensis serovar morrisoni str. 4AA1]
MEGATTMQTNLLSSTDTMIFKPALAKQIGLNEAIVLQQIHYWLEKSNHNYDGRVWVYNTAEKWNDQFSWWSLSTMKRMFNKLEKEGYLLTGNYNKKGFDRTKWYSIDYERLTYASCQNESMESVKMNQCNVSEWPDPKHQNESMQQVNMTLTIPETTQRIPETTTKKVADTVEVPKKNNKIVYSPEFEEVWKHYPKKRNKPKCYTIYKNAVENKHHNHDVILYGVIQYAKECLTKGTDQKYIKYPEGFLNDERYLEYRRMDEVKKERPKSEDIVLPF